MTTQNNPTAPVSVEKNNKKSILFIASAFALLILICLIYWFFLGRFNLVVDDAYVKGDLRPISSMVGGTITKIHVHKTQDVNEGDILVELDDTRAKVLLEKSQAQLLQNVRQVGLYQKKVQEMEKNLIYQKAALELAQNEAEHRINLAKLGAIPNEELEKSLVHLKNSETQYQLAIIHLQEAQIRLGNGNVEEHPLIIEAASMVRESFLNLKNTRILAPKSGHIVELSARIGEVVSEGKILLKMVSIDEDLRIEANVLETDLRYFYIGQPCELTSEFYGDKVPLTGYIEGINLATGASASILPPENAAGNWVKVLQRIPVIIKLNSKNTINHPLMIGMSMKVHFTKQTTKLGPFINSIIDKNYIKQTSIYNNQLDPINDWIQEVITTNLTKSAAVSDD